eukprot:5166969-Pleurochrysis_carterae.AAC.1
MGQQEDRAAREWGRKKKGKYRLFQVHVRRVLRRYLPTDIASPLRKRAFLSGSFAAAMINGSLPDRALRLSHFGVSRVLPAVN